MENVIEHGSLACSKEGGSFLKGGNALLQRNAWSGGGRELLPEDFKLLSLIPFCQ